MKDQKDRAKISYDSESLSPQYCILFWPLAFMFIPSKVGTSKEGFYLQFKNSFR